MKETKFISEVEYLNFKKSLRNIVIKIIIGFFIGVVFGLILEQGVFASIFLGIMFGGMPYAWSVIPVSVFGWVAIAIKLIASIMLGWVITPIALTYNFLKMKKYEKAYMGHISNESGKVEDQAV